MRVASRRASSVYKDDGGTHGGINDCDMLDVLCGNFARIEPRDRVRCSILNVLSFAEVALAVLSLWKRLWNWKKLAFYEM